jgi:hypothetical protein
MRVVAQAIAAAEGDRPATGGTGSERFPAMVFPALSQSVSNLYEGSMVKPVVGKDVDSWCTRCKLILAHTVEAMVGAKVTRVHCNTCGSQHAFRPTAPGKSAAASKAAASKARDAKMTSEKQYEALLRGKDASKARNYAPSERFAATELIRHPTFGLGFVLTVKESNKIEVAFADGPKVLAHGR